MATLYDTFKSKGIVENLPNEFLAGELKYIHWAGYKWRPIDNKKSNVIGYQTNLNNLNLKLYGSELQIENSLQKFFMGNNYENFSFTQVLTAFEKLNKLLPIDIYKTQVNVLILILYNYLKSNIKFKFIFILNQSDFSKYLNFLNSSGEIKFFLQKITHALFYKVFCLFITTY